MPMSMASEQKMAPGSSRDLLLEAYWQATGMDAKSKMKGMEPFTRILGFRFEVSSPTDQQSGHASGRRQYKPLVISKFTDQSTPLIFQALAKNSLLDECKIVYYQTKPDGSGTVKQGELTLKKCRVIHHEIQAGGPDARVVEEVAFTFDTIIIKDLPSTKEHEDSWTDAIHG